MRALFASCCGEEQVDVNHKLTVNFSGKKQP